MIDMIIITIICITGFEKKISEAKQAFKPSLFSLRAATSYGPSPFFLG